MAKHVQVFNGLTCFFNRFLVQLNDGPSPANKKVIS